MKKKRTEIMKRIEIPKIFVDRAKELSEALKKIDYTKAGFISEPSHLDVIRKSILLGLEQLERQVGQGGFPLQFTPEKEQNKVENLFKQPNSTSEKAQEKPLEKTRETVSKKKKISRSILGDFG